MGMLVYSFGPGKFKLFFLVIFKLILVTDGRDILNIA